MTAKQKRIISKLDDPKFKTIDKQNRLITVVCVAVAIIALLAVARTVKHYYDVQNCINQPIIGYWDKHNCNHVLNVK